MLKRLGKTRIDSTHSIYVCMTLICGRAIRYERWSGNKKIKKIGEHYQRPIHAGRASLTVLLVVLLPRKCTYGAIRSVLNYTCTWPEVVDGSQKRFHYIERVQLRNDENAVD